MPPLHKQSHVTAETAPPANLSPSPRIPCCPFFYLILPPLIFHSKITCSVVTIFSNSVSDLLSTLSCFATANQPL